MDNLFNRVARQRRRGQRGFTLIELLVVIAVLAILAAIVIFNVTGVTNRGATSACKTDLKSVQTASDAYHNDNGTYPTAGGGAGAVDLANPGKLVPAYIHTPPNSTGVVTLDASGTATAASCP
jgi:general secretion pathway protein G